MIQVSVSRHARIERIDPDQLPRDWRSAKGREQLQSIGAAWIKRRSSAALAVPSSVIPAESNYLLNPLHPAFARIEIGQAKDFVTDLRLIRRLT